MASSSKFSSRSGRPLHGQAREVVYNVAKYLRQNKKEFKLKYNVNESVKEATGVGLSTIKAIIKDAELNKSGDQRTTELTFDEDCSESERNSPCCTLPQPPAKKLKEADQVERQNELLKLACDLLSTSSKPEESNEFLDIGKVWGTKLMSLDPMQRKFAEKAINEILFEADLGTLHRDSVKINHNPNSDPFESI